jgi:hypothetical protein
VRLSHSLSCVSRAHRLTNLRPVLLVFLRNIGVCSLSFGQTMALFVELQIPWPSALRSMMEWLSVLNINLELLKPECNSQFGAVEKLQLALSIPFFFVGSAGAYVAVKIAMNRFDMSPELIDFLKRKVVTILSTLFTTMSIFFMRAVLKPFDCITESGSTWSADGQRFMASSPDVVCSDADPHYPTLVALSSLGLVLYSGSFVALALGMYSAMRADNPSLGLLAFLGDKYEQRHFYWECIIVARKLGLMVSFFLFSETHAWLMGTTVLITALVAHTAARPYEDAATDWGEFLTLIANLLVLVSGPVFMVITESDELSSAAGFRDLLEIMASLVMAGALAATAYAQYTVWHAVRLKGEDYKIRVVTGRLADIEATAVELQRQLSLLKVAQQAIDERNQTDHKFGNSLHATLESRLSGMVGTSASHMNPLHADDGNVSDSDDTEGGSGEEN